jgi:hypothetical protein
VVATERNLGLHALLMIPLLGADEYGPHRLSHRIGWLCCCAPTK